MEKPPKFYVRCSGIGEIMTNPKGKSVAEQIDDLEKELADRREKISQMKPGLKPTEKALQMTDRVCESLRALYAKSGESNLSEVCKTHLKKWLIRELTGKHIDFKSKPTDKGNAVEDDAIVYASCHIPKMGLCCKNEKRYYDGFMIGTPDVIAGKLVVDLKSSLSAETFPMFEAELPENDYAWQVQGYMGLLKANGLKIDSGAVVYALMSMPDEMIEREARYKLGAYYDQEQYEAFAANYRYDDLPPAMRLKKYPVEWDESKVQAIRDRVVECRNYIETVLWPAYLSNINQFTF